MIGRRGRRHALRLAEIKGLRATWGRSALLFLTDRCPVGCDHCSVDSRPDSPSIRDWPLFEAIVEGLCAAPGLTCVGISGGEPFVERRGLQHAVGALSAAGKQLVLYTSGVWARPSIPDWVVPVLEASASAFLSTDGFHRAAVSPDQMVAAMRAIADAGSGLVVAVLDDPHEVARARALLVRAFGRRWRRHAEIMRNPPLPYGRGHGVFARGPRREAAALAPCTLASSPVIRYDGRATACCNEEVIMGGGPPELAARVDSAAGVKDVLARFAGDSLHRLIGSLGPGQLVHLPGFDALAADRYGSVCELCWAMRRADADKPRAPLVELLGRLARARDLPAEEELPCCPG